MRDQAGATSKAATGTQEPSALYIITLLSSTAPLPIQTPAAPELAGLAVFRSRRVEDGRDRYRLHLGYFETLEAAESTLQVVREIYPAAWIGGAPNAGLGSLDDTSVAQFKFIPAPKKPAAGPSNGVRPTDVAAAHSVASAKNSRPAAPLMAPAEVLALLEPPPAKPLHESKPSATQAAATENVAGAIQHFAVQLVWSMDPIDMAKVVRLAIFDAYTLYKVQIDRVGRRWYGLRLGFFADPVSARQVSLYARSDFTAAAVVPVSERECERAAHAAVTVAPAPAAEPSRKASEFTMELVDTANPSPPRVKLAPAARESRPAAKSAPLPKRVAERKSQQSQTAKSKTSGRARSKSTEELISELGVDELSLAGGNDPVNDSGVRHLSISVVRSKSRLGKLFSHGVRRRS